MEFLIPILIIFCLIVLEYPDIFTKFGEWFASEKTPLSIHTAYIVILILLPLVIFAAILYFQS
jgi:hypothetical protein